MVISRRSSVRSTVARKTRKNVEQSYDAVLAGDAGRLEEIQEREDYIDYLNGEIARYIVSLMSVEMSERTQEYQQLLSDARKWRRIGDHAINIAEYTQFMKNGRSVLQKKKRRDP